ncbi:hypothetical protein P5V15_005907 [Pogonomyrmex californicus]
MAITKEHIRFSIHFAFHLKKNAAEATAMICAAYEENAELAEQLGVTQQTISVRLHTMGKVQKEGRWVPHELSEDNKNRRRDTAHFAFKVPEKRFSA